MYVVSCVNVLYFVLSVSTLCMLCVNAMYVSHVCMLCVSCMCVRLCLLSTLCMIRYVMLCMCDMLSLRARYVCSVCMHGTWVALDGYVCMFRMRARCVFTNVKSVMNVCMLCR